MVAVAIAIQGREHDTEGAGPLAEEDEEMVSKTLLREQKTAMMHYKKKQKTSVKKTKIHYLFILMFLKPVYDSFLCEIQ